MDSSATPRKRPRWRTIRTILFFTVFTGSLVTIIFGIYVIAMPGDSYRRSPPSLTADETALSARLRRHVTMLAHTIGPRNVLHPRALQQTETYIAEQLAFSGFEMHKQPYTTDGITVHNLAIRVPGTTRSDQIVVVGAHHDSWNTAPGADDNASGVAAVIEIANLLRHTRHARSLHFVSFSNEEPPYFQTDLMGSLVYARECKKKNLDIVAMISLETIGYYTDAPKSQAYPFPFSLFYPSVGNFVTFVGNVSSRPLVHYAIDAFRRHATVPSEGAAAPVGIRGIDLSDHWAFWQQGYPALMVTDTAPFRNPHYHLHSDTADKLDYERLARTTIGLAKMVYTVANQRHLN